jgi:hypothetical protein
MSMGWIAREKAKKGEREGQLSQNMKLFHQLFQGRSVDRKTGEQQHLL